MKYIKILTILISIGFSSISFAQKPSAKQDDIVFLLRQEEHLNQAIKTIGALKQKNVSKIGPAKVVIILCGEMLKNISSTEMKLSPHHKVVLSAYHILSASIHLYSHNKSHQ